MFHYVNMNNEMAFSFILCDQTVYKTESIGGATMAFTLLTNLNKYAQSVRVCLIFVVVIHTVHCNACIYVYGPLFETRH